MIVSEYNRHMGGMDFSDQLKVYYSHDRKSKQWWIRLFFHFIDTAIVNAYVLYLHCYRLGRHPPMTYQPKDQLTLYQLTLCCELNNSLVNHFSC